MFNPRLLHVLTVLTIGFLLSAAPSAYALTFGSAIRISTNTYYSGFPSVAAYGSYVYVAWEDFTPVSGSGTAPEIWLKWTTYLA